MILMPSWSTCDDHELSGNVNALNQHDHRINSMKTQNDRHMRSRIFQSHILISRYAYESNVQKIWRRSRGHTIYVTLDRDKEWRIAIEMKENVTTKDHSSCPNKGRLL